MGGYASSGMWDNGTPEPILREEDRLCLTDFRPIQIPPMRTNGIPIPSPTPRPTLTVSVLELVALEGGADAVSELLWRAVLKVELAITLVIDEDGDGTAVDKLELVELELELDEPELDELELDEP